MSKIVIVVSSAASRGHLGNLLEKPAVQRLKHDQQHARQEQRHNELRHHLEEHDARPAG